MKKFPSICIDDFYSDPEAIRKFALDQDFCFHSPEWPGRRTKPLSELDYDLYVMFSRKFLSIYYGLQPIKWKIETSFQIIEPFSDDKNSPKNLGWIHRDDTNYTPSEENVLCAGVIFLTPNIEKNAGTCLYKRVNYWSHTDDAKRKYYGDSVDDNYDEHIHNHYKDFEETVRFNNYFNRLISFDASTYHGVHSFYSSNLPRLTQVFFVKEVISNQDFPLYRKEKVLYE